MKNKAALLFFALCLSVTSFAQSLSANFTSDIKGGCSPIVVNFQDQSTGNPTTWKWDFGNGSTSTKQNPSATYFNTGTYTVTLTITNGANTNTTVKTAYITVFIEPKADFIALDRNGCTPAKIRFTDRSTSPSGTNIVGWKWDFGDGNSSTERNPIHTYRTAGSFTVTLSITNDVGCTRLITKPNYIDIIQGVVPNYTIDDPGVCSAPSQIKFNNTSTGPGTLTYLWNLGNGVITSDRNPSTTYNTNGNYTVTFAVTSSEGCSDTVQQQITVGKANTDFTIPDKICPKVPVQFLNNSSPRPIKAYWEFSNGTTDTLRNGMTVFNTPGTYTITLTNTYTICTDKKTKTITVLPGPKVDFIASDTGKCQPVLTVNFQNKSDGTTYNWDFGDGGKSTDANPTYNFTKSGVFDVTLIATSANGCSDTLKKKEYIKIKKPIITFPDLPTNGCIPYTFKFRADIETTDTVVSYNWQFGDGNSSTDKTPTHTYTQKGSYAVTLTITTKGGCTETLTLQNAVEVGPLPIPDFTSDVPSACAQGGIQFINKSKNAISYLWQFSDGSTSTEFEPKHTFVNVGPIDVTLIAINNGCENKITKRQFVTIRPSVSRFDYQPNCNNPLEITFIDKSIQATTWKWDFGHNNSTSNAQNPGTHTFPGYGTYKVTLTTTNGNCTYTLTRDVIIANYTPDFSSPDKTEGCKPFNATLIPTVPNRKLIKEFVWDFGDGNTTTVDHEYAVYHTYSKPGIYKVTLTTIDTFGCKHIIAKDAYFKVNGSVVDFNSANSSGCKGLIANFTDATKSTLGNTIVSWRWDFGDGTIKTFSAPPFQHRYDSIGDYDVKLIVTDSKGCTDSVVKREFIKISSLKASWSNYGFSCPKSPISFNNTSTSDLPFTYSWDMGDGTKYSQLNVIHAYNNVGTYTVKLMIRDELGCEDSLSKVDSVFIGLPKASFDANNFTTYCVPFEAKFTNNSTYYDASFWSLGQGQGTSTLTNPNTYYSITGQYPIKLVVTSPGGCKDSVQKTMNIFNPSDGTLLYKPLFGCRPRLVDFEAFSEMKARFIWDFGDGNVVDTTINKISHIYESLGDFVPRIILRQPEGCLVPLMGTQTIEIIGARAKFGLEKNLFCDSGYIKIIDSTQSLTKDRITNYSWDFGDGNTSNNFKPSHQYTSPGIYDIRLAVETATGCKDTSILRRAVKIAESPIINIGGDSVICVNQSMRHLGVFDRVDTSAIKWQWQLPNGTNSTLQNPALQQYKSGNYTVKAIATNSSGCADTTTKDIIVNALPVITLPASLTKIVGMPVTLPATYSSGTVSYSWTPANTLDCPTCPQPVAMPKFTTTYKVAAIDSNNCVNNAEIQVKVICEGATIFAPNTFSPNGDGANDIFFIRGKGLDRVKSLRIFNRWGEVVFEQRDFPVNNQQYGWDGKFKGTKANADVYIYQVEVFCENGEIIRFDGSIALIK